MSRLGPTLPAPAGPSLDMAARSHPAARVEPPAAEWHALVLRLIAFAALGLFAALHWARFVQPAPSGRMLLAVLVATAGAAVLGLLGTAAVRARLDAEAGDRPRLARALLHGLATVVALATLMAGLLVAGLPAHLLKESGWAELADGIDRGLAAGQNATWPYAGDDEWARRTLVLGAPLLLALAAALAFWPAARGAGILRVLGLVALLLLYGVPVTEDDPGAPLLRGFLLLVLLAGWLWLPRLGSREALAGAAVVAGVGILSLPLAAALDARNAWWDYRGWELFGESKSITFDWSHRYGPLDWPRRGTTLLNVRADPGQYWKAETLDRFDGVRWVRSREIQTTGVPEGLPTDLVQRGRTWDYGEWNDKWAEEIRFTVRSLSSNLILGAGTTLSVEGADPYVQATDGTTSKIGDPLEQGDSYTVRAYVPSPTAKQMRQAPAGYSPGLQDWTRIEVPQGFSGETATIELPLWGGGTFGDPDVPAELLAASPYARMYEAAREVTADSRTVYDAAKDVERYLDEVASYKEQVKRSEYPLVSFLFRDKVGYCQQFSGAMALMLRMVGIPARVAAGFSPGSLNRDTGEYRVRDFDAHSWVEVNINGIGWVRFDPTPSASPALAQSTDERRPGVSVPGGLSRDAAGSVIADAGSGGEGQAVTGEEGGIAPVVILLTLVLLGCGGLVAYRLYSRSRSMSPEDLAEAQLAELPRALARLGWELPRQTTLLGLERRFGRTAGPQAVRYAAALRAYRYHAGAPTPPGMSERRALRRELTSTGGWGARIRGLLAIPPGGPRPVR